MLTAVAMLFASGCASGPEPRAAATPIGAALAQPIEDLNLMGDDPSLLLERARNAPFRPPSDCAAATREIDLLDAALAPHLPGGPGEVGQGAALAGDVIRSVARLPFRGVVRRITGAERRAEAQRAAVMAGVRRRGYLEGWRTPPRCAHVADVAPATSQPPAG